VVSIGMVPHSPPLSPPSPPASPPPPFPPYTCPDGGLPCHGNCLRAVPSDECPHGIGSRTPNCNANGIAVGDFCEADGECGTSNLNNCQPGGFDIYQVEAKIPVPPSSPPALPSSPPSPPASPPPPFPPYTCPDGGLPCHGNCLRAVPSDECPDGLSRTTPNCNANGIAVGDFCEADGECGTSNLNNCQPGGWDIYHVEERPA
jgi:hypothetical protein